MKVVKFFWWLCCRPKHEHRAQELEDTEVERKDAVLRNSDAFTKMYLELTGARRRGDNLYDVD